MRMIIGLGNPGKKYSKTRHNAGFMAIDYFAKYLEVKFSEKFNSKIAVYGGYILAKPQTFMNNSGEEVLKLVKYYKPNELIIVYDDIDLPIGYFRRYGKSAGGHKGMDSIIKALKTYEIKRIRIGIKPDKSVKTEIFVLEDFDETEEKLIKIVINNLCTFLLDKSCESATI